MTSETTTSPLTDCLAIGSIVRSNSHLDYVVEVYNERDRERPPESHECGFGQPVCVEITVEGQPHAVFGVVYDTKLVDPDQGRAGPRLAQSDQAQFTPGYIEERTTLAGVALLGTAALDDDDLGSVSHTMPRWTLQIDDEVWRCPDSLLHQFHTDEDGRLVMEYWDRLLDVAGPLGAEVTLELVDRLRAGLDDEESRRILDVVERNVRWRASSDRGVVR